MDLVKKDSQRHGRADGQSGDFGPGTRRCGVMAMPQTELTAEFGDSLGYRGESVDRFAQRLLSLGAAVKPSASRVILTSCCRVSAPVGVTPRAARIPLQTDSTNSLAEPMASAGSLSIDASIRVICAAM